MADHPDVNTLLDLVMGRVVEPTRTELNEHLANCESCHAQWASLSQQHSDSQGVEPTIALQTKAIVSSSTGPRLEDASSYGSPIAPTIIHGPATQPASERAIGQSSAKYSTHIDAAEQSGHQTNPFPNQPAPSSFSRSSLPTEIGQLIGPYLIEAKLGEGGMGAVYRARHTKLDKLVALKILPSHATHNPQFVARFEREMKAVGKLDHPQIVRALDAGEINGVHYLAMEYIEGTDLHEVIRARGNLSVVNACKAVRQAAQALAAAHAAGLVHRDIKPANLFLAKSGQLKILDLGLALLGEEANAHTELTAAGQTFGTPDYMAPEQWEGAHATDGRVDLYALGCTLHFLLMGKAPYDTPNNRSLLSKMKAHAMAPIPSMCDARSDVPAELDALFQKLMAKEPASRVQTAAELVDALLPFTIKKSKVVAETSSEAIAKAPAEEEPSETRSDALSEPSLVVPNEQAPVPELGPSTPSDSLVINTSAFSKPKFASAVSLKRESASNSKRPIVLIGAVLLAVVLLAIGALVLHSWTSKNNLVAENRSGTPSNTEIEPEPSSAQTPSPTKAATALPLEANGVSAQGSSSTPQSPPPASPPIAATSSQSALDFLTKDDASLGAVDLNAERAAAVWALANRAMLVVKTPENAALRITSAEDLTTPFAIVQMHINDEPIDDESLKQISGCRRLANLVLGGNRITGIGLRHLSEMRSLVDLQFTWQKNSAGDPTLVTDPSLSTLNSLAGLPNLTSIDLVGNDALTDGCLDYLVKMQRLESIGFGGRSITNAGLAKISALTELQRVRISECEVDDIGLEAFIATHPKLNSLRLDSEKLTSRSLINCRNLQMLEMRGTSINDADMESLATLPRLSELGLFFPKPYNIPQLLRLPHLEKCSLNYHRAGEMALSADKYAALARHPMLTALYVGGASGSPDDESLMKLARMPKLKILEFAFDERWEKVHFTIDGINRFRQQRPDVQFIVAGRSYAPDTHSAPVIQLNAVESPEQLASAIPLERSDSSAALVKGIPKPATPSIAAWPALVRSTTSLKSKPGTPISGRSLVSMPAGLKDLASWSVELVHPVGGTTMPAVSPDGQQIAIAGNDALVRIWQRSSEDPTQLRLVRLLIGENPNIIAICWSHSGEFLALAFQNGKQVVIYHVETGERVRSLPLETSSQNLSWSPNDRYLAVAGWGMSIIDLFRNTQAQLKEAGNCQTVVWSPDSTQFLALNEWGNELRQWNIEGLAKVAGAPIAGTSNTPPSWSPDGANVVIGTNNGHILLWDPVSHRFTRDVALDQPDGIMSIGWEPPQASGKPLTEHGYRLLVATTKIRIFNQAIDKELANNASYSGSDCRWSPDGSTVIAGSGPRLFDAQTGNQLALGPRGLGPFTTASLSHDGKLLRSVKGVDMHLFDAETGDYIRRITNMPADELLASPKDDWLLCYTYQRADNQLYLIDTATYEKRIPLVGHEAMVTCANWSPNGLTLATGGKDKTVRIWQPSTAKVVTSLVHPAAVQNVVWSPDGKQLITCTEDAHLRSWNAASGVMLKDYGKLSSKPAAGNQGIAWSSLSPTLAIASSSGALDALDLRTGAMSEIAPTLGQALSIASLSPDGKVALGVTYANGLTGRMLSGKSIPSMDGHGTIQWLPDSRRMISSARHVTAVQAFDVRKFSRLGTLIPNLPGDRWITIGAEGHYRGSPGVEADIIYVALHKDGSQTTHTPAEFERTFGWKNDPAKATLTKLNERTPTRTQN